MSSKEKAAINAAEEYIVDQYTSLTRHTIRENWGLKPREFAKLEFNADGSSLACGIQSSKIIEHVEKPCDEEEWIVEVVPDIGVECDPEQCRVYQSVSGDWIVEQA